MEEILLQYGILGVWTLTLLGERYYYNRKVGQVIDNNTVALTKVYEVINNRK